VRASIYERDPKTGRYWVDRIEDEFAVWLASKADSQVVTEEMILAYKRALKNHIDQLPAQRISGKRGGFRVDERTKAIVRIGAVLSAALNPIITPVDEMEDGK
jgi:hypothetical protein